MNDPYKGKPPFIRAELGRVERSKRNRERRLRRRGMEDELCYRGFKKVEIAAVAELLRLNAERQGLEAMTICDLASAWLQQADEIAALREQLDDSDSQQLKRDLWKWLEL